MEDIAECKNDPTQAIGITCAQESKRISAAKHSGLPPENRGRQLERRTDATVRSAPGA
jgi:hypothetical protein